LEVRLYPNWNELNVLKNPLTDGERALIKYLDDNLPRDSKWQKSDPFEQYDGWLIFAQPFLNGSRPDIIVFNPFVGIVIYEVKDWNIHNYKWIKQDGLTSLFGKGKNGGDPIKNPIDQVEHYKEKIISQLVPIIGETIDKNKKRYGLIKTALYFHKIETMEVQKFFGTRIKNYKHTPLFGHDYLAANRLNFIIPDVHITKSRYWDRSWNLELMFWFKPPYHSIEQGIPLNLKHNQIKVGEPKPGHHRVRGVAGSGKTQALAYRASKLAADGYKVLIITYNITLWHYIRDMIQRSPFGFEWANINFNHFHGFCKDLLNQFGHKWPNSPQRNSYQFHSDYERALAEFFKSTVPEAVENALESDEYQMYDAVLIDEGQDYHYEWYSVLDKKFLTDRDELLVVMDKKQNIYERQLDWVDKRVTREGLEKFKDPYIDLTVTFRMPQKVAELANNFSETFKLVEGLKVSKIEGGEVLFHSQHIVWRNIDDDKWLESVYDAFRRLKKEGYNPSDMVFLLPNHVTGMEAVELFRSKNVEVNHVFETETDATYHPHKRAFWMGDRRVKMSTIHSFKGWELLNIVMYIPKNARENPSKLDAIVYTAITRTRENLIVLNAHPKYVDFGMNFPGHWDKQ
jgi:hypothetical protein